MYTVAYSAVHPQVHTRTRATRNYLHSNGYKSSQYAKVGLRPTRHTPTNHAQLTCNQLPAIPLIHTCTLYVTHALYMSHMHFICHTHTHTHTHTHHTHHTHTPHTHHTYTPHTHTTHTHTHLAHMHTYSSTHMVLTDGVARGIAHGRGNIRLVPICFCRYLRHLVQ